MEIGRLLRANGVEVFIPGETRCISACVLILAGGASRTISGRVGLHNPHFLRAGGPGDNVQALLAETQRNIRSYLQTMGVAGSLADAMFALPEGTVHILRPDELLHYRLQ